MQMKKIISFLLLAVTILSCQLPNEKNEKSVLADTPDKDVAEGWQSLFDGTSLKGWHKYGGAPAGSAWKAENGTLLLDTAVKENWQVKNGGDIVTDEVFENFHLKLEWKIAPGGNSGIMFYVHEDTALYKYPWETGPEMQVLDNAAHPDGKLEKHRAGDLYDLLSCSTETVMPAGEWNLAEIICSDGKLDFLLNGVNVVSTSMWTAEWSALLKQSKWKDYKDFSIYKKGRIALQDHGNMVWFRNIRIKKL